MANDAQFPEQMGEATRLWFQQAFAAPTAVQVEAWDAIASGTDTLVVSPTGSGKTLAAFLWALDDLFGNERSGCRVLYISPLRALAADVERNLRAPLAGIERTAQSLGVQPRSIRTAIRSADTSPTERQRMSRTPPDILITTPESLYLLLTSKAGAFLRDVDTVIIDEIHSVAGTKRGSHLSLTLQRLDHLTGQPAQRIGLSATVNGDETVAEYLHAGHEVRLVKPRIDKPTALQLSVPVSDMADMAATGDDGSRSTSIWPAVESAIVDLVTDHTSTIVFTNSRRVCERLSNGLNELADRQLARAHHGSVSKSERAVIEDELKSGRLPAVVATSSLELGIDMGAIDLMVQVGCPPSVASGLQRLGRAGHRLDAVSRGVFFPTHRGDLLATAVAVEQMHAGRIEPLRIPRHPLDVLSQQVVAMVAMQQWHVDDLYATVTAAAGYTNLPRNAFDAVLDMLAGRYPSDEFAQLRPRIVWDRSTGMLSAHSGAQRAAVISAGTIPDRGLFPVFIAGTKDSRVGELDEEMVYESRVGDVISLGASSWRIEEITYDRVLVTPAPGRPAKLPFWHADAQGRSFQMGQAIAAFLRHAESRDVGDRLSHLDDNARANLAGYLSEQLSATGVLPTDQRIVVERFRDEIGDWRIVVHAPWGARVTSPWALLVGDQLRTRLGVDADVMATDDGMVLRILDTDQDQAWWDDVLDALAVDPDDLTTHLSSSLTTSSVFAAKFRECSSRALLLSRNAPGRRTPLWQQRQRSHQLLSVAGKYPSFPMVLEAVRECLDDLYDVPSLRQILQQVRDGLITMQPVTTERPSPMAATQMFSYISVFMYEADNPLAQQAVALELDHALLTELLSDADLRSIVPQEAIDEVAAELQWRNRGPARNADDLADLLRVVGFESPAELLDRGVGQALIDELLAGRRAFEVRVAGREVIAAAADMARLRDALGVVLPPDVPDAFSQPVADPVGDLISRYARTHGPFTTGELAEYFGLGVGVVEHLLQERRKSGRLRWGRFSSTFERGQWIDPDVLQRVRRRTAAILRGTVEPVPGTALCGFLPRWHGLGSPSRGTAAVLSAIERLQGIAAPAVVWEHDLLPVRVGDFEAHLLDHLTAAGEVIWCGTGRSGTKEAVSLVLAGNEDLLPAADPEGLTDEQQQVWDLLQAGGGWFFRDISARLPHIAVAGLQDALWELVWRAMVTNDSLAALRQRRATGARRHRTDPGMPGRWSAVARPGRADTGLLWAQTLLERYGIVDRTATANERVPGGFHGLFSVLRRMDEAGRCQQVYAVSGLGGAQFAAPLALERLRSPAKVSVLLAATDPANPLGITVAWPEMAGGRPTRKAGALVWLTDRGPMCYLDASARHLLVWDSASESDLSDFVQQLRRRRPRFRIRRINNEEAFSSPWSARLQEAGLTLTPSGLR